MSTTPGFRAFVAAIADVVALVLALPAASLCWLERALNPTGEGIFQFWAHCFALAPGVPGNYLRRGFYRLTIDRCHGRFIIGFGALFVHRKVEVQEGVYIGPYAIVGSAVLRKRCSIGSRVSLLSGANLHELGEDGRWTPYDPSRLQQIDIGEDVFIGEAAVVMADVGERAMVSAGAVVSAPVPRELVVAGNPARFVRRIEVPAARVASSSAEQARPLEAGRLAFVDWMKCLGMFLIVFGHVFASPLNLATPPIYPKQLGVALFMFVSGYTLARERRPVMRVIVGRLFEIILFGLAFAVFISMVRMANGLSPNLSNYPPFLLGANVLLDYFPANTTTWYIGTYIHVILLWALVLRHVRIAVGLLGIVLIGEVVVRGLLWQSGTHMIAYMLITNWLTVFLLGMFSGQQSQHDVTWRPAKPWILLSGLGVLWIALAPIAVAFDQDFPFRHPALQPEWRALTLMSVGVSAIYLGLTWLAFRVTSHLPLVDAIRFIATNTVFIFVVHMPLYYVLQPLIAHWPRLWRGTVLLLVCFVGLALAGEVFRRLVRPAVMRDHLVRRLESALEPQPAASSAAR